MERNERNLRSRFGTENHFRVPEGYFEDLTGRIMGQLPVDTSKSAKVMSMPTTRVRYHWMVAIAASLLVAVSGGAVWLHEASKVKPSSMNWRSVAPATEVSSDITFNMAADYAMIDNEDIYASLENQ